MIDQILPLQRKKGGRHKRMTTIDDKKIYRKYRHLKFDNQQLREFQHKKYSKLFCIERPRKIESFARF